MGSCSTCAAKSKIYNKAKFDKETPQPSQGSNFPHDENLVINRQSTVGAPITIHPDHPLASYSFPRTNSLLEIKHHF